MKRAFLIGLLFLSPSLAFAAGFAKQSLFLSRSTVTEGDTVLIHAVVNNQTATKFTGELNFEDASSTIGSVPVSLSADESSVMSVSWKPAAGTHSISAELTDSSGALVDSQTEDFTILPAAQAAPAAAGSSQSAAAVESSSGIQQGIGSVSPQAETAAQPVFAAIDSARASAAGVLDNQLAVVKQDLGPGAGSPGEVLGAQATQNAGSNPTGALWYILQTLYFYLLTILRFIVGSAGVFYPVVAVIFLYFLWRMFKRFRRPAY